MLYFNLSQMRYIEQFVKERQEILPLRTRVSYFFTFPKNICGVSVVTFALQRTVHVYIRGFPRTPTKYYNIRSSTSTNVAAADLTQTPFLEDRICSP